MWIILTAAIITALLTAYAKVEGRINKRPCPECGFRVSKDGPDEDCPQCGSLIPALAGTTWTPDADPE